jgi:excisionase family DNA binding protein
VPDNQKFLTAAEVAARLGVHSRTVRRLIERGEFPNAFRLGEAVKAPYVIPEPDLIAYEKKASRRL